MLSVARRFQIQTKNKKMDLFFFSPINVFLDLQFQGLFVVFSAHMTYFVVIVITTKLWVFGNVLLLGVLQGDQDLRIEMCQLEGSTNPYVRNKYRVESVG